MAKNKGGRPTLYKPEFDQRAYELAKQGLLGDMIAVELGVSGDAFCEWLEKYDGFRQSVTRGRCEFDRGMLAEYQSILRAKTFNEFDKPDARRRGLEWWLMNRHRKELVGERMEVEAPAGMSPAAQAWEERKKRLKIK